MHIKDVLINLVQSLEEIADHQAMPDGSEGDSSESFWLSGNISRKNMDLARMVVGHFSGENAKVICIKAEKVSDSDMFVPANVDVGQIYEAICVEEVPVGGNKKELEIAIMSVPGRVHQTITEKEFVENFRVIDASSKKTYPDLFSESAEAVKAKRQKEADFLFENWSFPFEVKDSDGWNIAGCDWTRSVYLEIPGQQESVRVIFYIVFEIGNNTVIRKQATFAGDQHIGTPSE